MTRQQWQVPTGPPGDFWPCPLRAK